MSTTTNEIEPNMPALIVFGTPTGTSVPQAAWFRGSYAERAKQASQRHAFRTIPVVTDETRAAAATLSEGQLKPGGQLILRDVTKEVLERLTRLIPVVSAVATPAAAGPTAVAARISSSLWDTLKITDYVLAAHLENGEPEGWYEAIIIKIEGPTYTLRWAYAPEEGLIRVQRRHIALMLPG